MGALDEAALYVPRSADPAQARADMDAVCDRLIAGIAGADVAELSGEPLKPPRRRP